MKLCFLSTRCGGRTPRRRAAELREQRPERRLAGREALLGAFRLGRSRRAAEDLPVEAVDLATERPLVLPLALPEHVRAQPPEREEREHVVVQPQHLGPEMDHVMRDVVLPKS